MQYRLIYFGMICFIIILGMQENLCASNYSWLSQAAKYCKNIDKLKSNQLQKMILFFEEQIGIHADGTIDKPVMLNVKLYLDHFVGQSDDLFPGNIDDVRLVNILYFYVIACYLSKDHHKIIHFFENVFYPNKHIFEKNKQYYQITLYYLSIVYAPTINKINKLTSSSQKNVVIAQAETKNFLYASLATLELYQLRKNSKREYKQFFQEKERKYLAKGPLNFFTNLKHCINLSNIDWYNEQVPSTACDELMSMSLLQLWNELTDDYRKEMYPVMLFSSDESENLQDLHTRLLQILRTNNHNVDLLILSVLKICLNRWVQHECNIYERIKYKKILDSINACPSGSVYYHAYRYNKYSSEIKDFYVSWSKLRIEDKKNLLEEGKPLKRIFDNALIHLHQMFDQLNHFFDMNLQNNPANYIFFKYRAEFNYYWEYMNFDLIKVHKNQDDLVKDSLNIIKNICLPDCKSALYRNPRNKENCINLFIAYRLLFQELSYLNKYNQIKVFESEMDQIAKDRFDPSLLNNKEDSRFMIYEEIAETYMKSESPVYQNYALNAAKKGFYLAKAYYRRAANQTGYIHNNNVGAIIERRTEKDDYERQYEFLQDISQRVGKNIESLLSERDIWLYKKLQDLRRQ